MPHGAVSESIPAHPLAGPPSGFSSPPRIGSLIDLIQAPSRYSDLRAANAIAPITPASLPSSDGSIRTLSGGIILTR